MFESKRARLVMALFGLLFVGCCSRTFAFNLFGNGENRAVEVRKALWRVPDAFAPSRKRSVEYDKEIKQQVSTVYSEKAHRVLCRIMPGIPIYDRYVWTVHTIKSDQMNAFTTCGTFIYVFSGLVDKCSEDGLAFVMSHEIGHCIAGHDVRQERMARNSNVLTNAFGLLLKGSGVNDLIGLVGGYQNGKYSRNHEREADVLGAIYAWKAGYDLREGAAFFMKLYDEYGEESLGNLFGTHPKLKERTARVNLMYDFLDGKIRFSQLGQEIQYVIRALVDADDYIEEGK